MLVAFALLALASTGLTVAAVRLQLHHLRRVHGPHE